MRRAAVILAVAGVAAGGMGLRIPPKHRNDPPKTVADQERENAAKAKKGDATAAAPAPVTPTTNPSVALAKAQANLTKVERHLREAFEKSDDYVKAVGELKKAQEGYDGAYKGMVTKLGDDPAYAAAVKEQGRAEGELAAGRGTEDAAKLAGVVLEARTAVHKLESDAAERDGGVVAAKGEIAKAKGAVEALAKGFEESMKSDPEYAAARQAVEAARPAKV